MMFHHDPINLALTTLAIAYIRSGAAPPTVEMARVLDQAMNAIRTAREASAGATSSPTSFPDHDRPRHAFSAEKKERYQGYLLRNVRTGAKLRVASQPPHRVIEGWTEGPTSARARGRLQLRNELTGFTFSISLDSLVHEGWTICEIVEDGTP